MGFPKAALERAIGGHAIMGVFDLRCRLSGLPTSLLPLASTDGASTCSMLLLEEVAADQWLPLTPAVRGVYDRYGRIELWPSHRTPLAAQVGERLTELWASGALTADFDDLEHQRNNQLGGAAAEFLGLASANVFNQGSLHLGGHRVLPTLWLDPVVAAIAADAPPAEDAERRFRADPTNVDARAVFCDWLMERGRASLAEFIRLEGQRGPFGAFGAAPRTAAFDAGVTWAVEHGRLEPIAADDGQQFTPEEERTIASEVWKRGDLTLRRVVNELRPTWTGPWKQAELNPPPPSGPVRRYAAHERYSPGERLMHARFGEGVVERAEAGKVSVRFGKDVRVLAQARG